MVKREIKFRAWDAEMKHMRYLNGPHDALVPDFNNNLMYVNFQNGEGGYELMQYTGLKDKNGVEIWENDIITFWVCYPTSQTHTGNDIPGGSYTEPDETQFVKLIGQVNFDAERGKWSYSLISKPPYQFGNCFAYLTDDNIPIIDREIYSLDYLKSIYGWNDISDNEWIELLDEVGFNSEDEMMKVVNEIEVIGNIYENPELL